MRHNLPLSLQMFIHYIYVKKRHEKSNRESQGQINSDFAKNAQKGVIIQKRK